LTVTFTSAEAATQNTATTAPESATRSPNLTLCRNPQDTVRSPDPQPAAHRASSTISDGASHRAPM
jgi:hypothetical protein